MKHSERNVVMMIADISGYTRFIISHDKALKHGQMIIGKLLETILEHVEAPIEVSRLEGDAVFMYAVDDGSEKLASILGGQVRAIYDAYRLEVKNLAETSICRCKACADIAALKLKIIIHSGETLITGVGRFIELAGIPPIVIHRLLKNSVKGDEYILISETAWQGVHLGTDVPSTRSEEHYDDVGTIQTRVVQIADWLGELHEPHEEADSSFAYEILRHEIQTEYAEVASCPTKGFHFHTGRHLAEILEYNPEDIALVPESALESFAGTGNPFSLGEMPVGGKVVDVGCGAGMDSFIAAHKVGPEGQVIGVDMTGAMLDKARSAQRAGGYENVEIREGFAEQLPVKDGWADVVISNGVLNLCPDKPPALSEIFRVLKPGGRLQFGDIMVKRAIPAEARKDIELWKG